MGPLDFRGQRETGYMHSDLNKTVQKGADNG